MGIDLLGGLSVERFLQEYWQKKPLFIPQAITSGIDWVSLDGLIKLASQEEVESRLVTFDNDQWQVEQGPFSSRYLKKLPDTNWTLLVQNVNHFLPAAAALLYQFNFIPYARLDDLMISYAPAGGTVGPHFDSYDVFLLQVGGRKRWQISDQADKTLIPGAPLKILQQFQPTKTWELQPGDMLYLPPGFAHYGVALEPGMTYSIGFRAPTTQELATQFLVYLQDRIELPGIYQDPDLQAQIHPAELSEQLIEKMRAMLAALRWDKSDMIRFMGHYLTEPKPHVFFNPPRRPLSYETFVTRSHKNGLKLALKTQILFNDKQLFVNGENYLISPDATDCFYRLADQRQLNGEGLSLDEESKRLLYQWYGDGYVEIA